MLRLITTLRNITLVAVIISGSAIIVGCMVETIMVAMS